MYSVGSVRRFSPLERGVDLMRLVSACQRLVHGYHHGQSKNGTSMIVLCRSYCSAHEKAPKAEQQAQAPPESQTKNSEPEKSKGWHFIEYKRGVQANAYELAPIDPSSTTTGFTFKTSKAKSEKSLLTKIIDRIKWFVLPDGYPASVKTPDYINYQLWQVAQSVASSMMTALALNALLGSVGVTSSTVNTVLATSASVQWILKDIPSHFGKIISSTYGYNFDFDPKKYRMFAEILWSCGIFFEMLAPAGPQYFVLIAGLANVFKGVASVAAGATKVAINQQLSRRNNLADVTAKAECQSVCANIAGTLGGLFVLNNFEVSLVGGLIGYFTLTSFQLYANYKALKQVNLHTLNLERSIALIRAYLSDKSIPSPWVLNTENIIFSSLTADKRCTLVELGSTLPHCLNNINNGEELNSLINIFANEKYILSYNIKLKRFFVVFNEKATLEDQLKSLLQMSYILHQVEKNAPEEQHTKKSLWGLLKFRKQEPVYHAIQEWKTLEEIQEKLRDSHDWVKQNFESFKSAIAANGWEVKYLYSGVSTAYATQKWWSD